ncbi:hypothetical protein [Kordia sp.]|uniref:hypothetical protein n=1 Tax=Kordia sp. TaxID=1965332 RepID=UPI003D28AF47
MKTRIKRKFQFKKVKVASINNMQQIMGGVTKECASGIPDNPKCAQITNTTGQSSRVEVYCNESEIPGACD